MNAQNPLYAASHIQRMADQVKDNRMSTAFMVMSGALLLLMLIKEGKDLLRTPANDDQRHNRRDLHTRVYDREESQKHQR